MSDKIENKPVFAIKVNEKDELDFVMNGMVEDIARMIAEVCLQDNRAMLIMKIVTGNINLSEAKSISRKIGEDFKKERKGYDKN